MTRPRPDQLGFRGHDVRLHLGGGVVAHARNDLYSDRLRCDHPPVSEGLGPALLQAAVSLRRSRVVVLMRRTGSARLRLMGFRLEATIPGFYRGAEDCMVLGYGLTPSRRGLANPKEVGAVDELLAHPREPRVVSRIPTVRAEATHAPLIASLLAKTFPEYPTPSGHPEYVARYIAAGNPVRFVESNGEVVACASADLVREARTAELTDCATRPDHRGRGYMQSLLTDLMGDLVEMDYPTAFTLARARIPGMNLAFQRLGFERDGIMTQSCRIGDGIEDINVWSRRLDAEAAAEPATALGSA